MFFCCRFFSVVHSAPLNAVGCEVSLMCMHVSQKRLPAEEAPCSVRSPLPTHQAFYSLMPFVWVAALLSKTLLTF